MEGRREVGLEAMIDRAVTEQALEFRLEIFFWNEMEKDFPQA
jgi:hypothetical protein